MGNRNLLNGLFRKKVADDHLSAQNLVNISTDQLLDYLRNSRSCTIYVGLDRRMYELDMNRQFTDQEWEEFCSFSEKYSNGKMFERAQELLCAWDPPKYT